MLILNRKPEERVTLYTSDGPVDILIMGVRGKIVTMGIDAPSYVRIVRNELEEERHNLNEKETP